MDKGQGGCYFKCALWVYFNDGQDAKGPSHLLILASLFFLISYYDNSNIKKLLFL